MKIHRFIGDFDLSKERLEVRDADLAHQIRSVLRMKRGETLILCDGKGCEREGEIAATAKNTVTIFLSGEIQKIIEPDVRVTLYCSLLKRENFELVCQKVTEIGVAEIVPIVAERTVKLNYKPDRLMRIIREAAEQAGRGRVPDLQPTTYSLQRAMEKAGENTVNFFFDQSGTQLKDLKIEKLEDSRVGVFTGPEGGWTSEEIENVRLKIKDGANFRIASLGRTTLRAETAAIVGAYCLIAGLSN